MRKTSAKLFPPGYDPDKDECARFSHTYPAKFFDKDRQYFASSYQYIVKKKQELFDPENLLLGKQIMNPNNLIRLWELGRQVQNFVEGVWNKHKFEIICEATRLKFAHNDSLLEQLILTGNKIFIYDAPRYDDSEAYLLLEEQTLHDKALMTVRNDLVELYHWRKRIRFEQDMLLEHEKRREEDRLFKEKILREKKNAA